MTAFIRRLLGIPPYFWLLVAAAWGAYLYYDWNTGAYKDILNERQSKETQLLSLNENAKKIEEFKRRRAEKLKELQDLGEKFKATADRMPRSASVPDLLKSLADISDKSGLEFSRFKPGANRHQQFLVVTPIEVTLKGTYVQVMTFLDAAANLTRVVAAEKLIFGLDSKGTSIPGPVNVVSATASLVTYYIDENYNPAAEAVNAANAPAQVAAPVQPAAPAQVAAPVQPAAPAEPAVSEPPPTPPPQGTGG